METECADAQGGRIEVGKNIEGDQSFGIADTLFCSYLSKKYYVLIFVSLIMNSMMKPTYLLLFIFTLLSTFASTQTLITRILFDEAHTVFKGKLSDIKYEESDGDGSAFTLKVSIQKYYKGARDYETIKFGVDKLDVIDLELDTMIMDYGIQMEKDASYFFFVNKLVQSNDKKSGYTWLVEPRIEGIPFSKELERILLSYRQSYKISTTGTSSIAFSTMMGKDYDVLIGSIQSIKEKKDGYHLKVKMLDRTRTVILSRLHCICMNSQIEIGNVYNFFVQKNDSRQLKLIDEWTGIIESNYYEKNRFENGLVVPYFVDKSIMGF